MVADKFGVGWMVIVEPPAQGGLNYARGQA